MDAKLTYLLSGEATWFAVFLISALVISDFRNADTLQRAPLKGWLLRAV